MNKQSITFNRTVKIGLSIPVILLTVFVLSGCSKNEQTDQLKENQLKEKIETQQAQIDELHKFNDEQQQKVSSANVQGAEPIIEEKEEIKTEIIPFKTINQNDSTIEKGETKIKQEGKNGTRELKYKIIYNNGQETNRELILEKTTVEPINKIVLVGTKEETKTSSESSSESSSNDSYSGKTKVTVFNIDCSNVYTDQQRQAQRQPGLDYIDRLKKDGEKIVEVREEKCKFVIIMEDNTK